jgi:hypothetical protein
MINILTNFALTIKSIGILSNLSWIPSTRLRSGSPIFVISVFTLLSQGRPNHAFFIFYPELCARAFLELLNDRNRLANEICARRVIPTWSREKYRAIANKSSHDCLLFSSQCTDLVKCVTFRQHLAYIALTIQ